MVKFIPSTINIGEIKAGLESWLESSTEEQIATNVFDRDIACSTGISRTSGHCKIDLLLTQFLFKCYQIEEKAFTYILKYIPNPSSLGEKLYLEVELVIIKYY